MKCTFCSKDIEKGTGKMYVLNTGRVQSFCSSKCEKNMKMGRDSRNFKWAKIR
ncbi:MAG TPA: 50S ribosomal protein L24e [archaeon]|nr:50S ribosomal protein L24e [archaeon]